MVEICKFDKNTDIGKTFEGLAPDINRMIETHQVTDGSSEVVYNGIKDLKDCGVLVDDVFEAILMQRSITHGLNANQDLEGSQGPLPTA